MADRPDLDTNEVQRALRGGLVNTHIKRARIIYFSGTGGTKRIAEAFEKELKEREVDVSVKNLGMTLQEKEVATTKTESGAVDLNILVFAVHGMDAPMPVYDWIGSVAAPQAGEKIAVFSVSGGGEMWPNKGCRNNCIKALESKGFHIVYDSMLCMPSNIFVSYNDHLIMWLLGAIPKKASRIVNDLLAGKEQRTHFRKGAVLDWVSKSERENAGKYARKFKISNECTGCGWCVQNCPMTNIGIWEQLSKPRFSDRCIMCCRCVYGCPAHAIKVGDFGMLKSGFDLDAVEQRMKGTPLDSLEKCCKGWLYKGVRDYLLDKY